MSNFATIKIEGQGIIVSTEKSSGYSGSDEKDMAYLDGWKKAYEPRLKKVFTVVERELNTLANGADAPALLRDLSKEKITKLDTVWEERIDGMDVPAHMKSGNGPCIYRMRLWNKGAVEKVDVELIISSLPPEEVRAGWKSILTAAIERDVKVGDFGLSPW
jgi:hypothetical protein